MESTLQKNISELYYIFENTTDGIVFEQNGIVVRLNRAVEQLLGYKREEIIGLQSQQFKNLILEGSSDRFLNESNHTFYVKKKDGQHFWATIKTNSFLNEEAIPASIWKIEDVSRLRDAELKLRQMSLAVEQSSNSVVITDTDGTIQYVNSAFTTTTGYSAHEVIGKNPSVLQSGRTPPHLFKEMWDYITHGMEWSGQFINKKKNGDFYEEHVAVAPIRDELGNITNFIASKENITELKKARKQAEKMSKAKGDFLAYVSHEIRTPLNVIAGMSELVLETDLETEQQQFMKRIKSSAHNLLSIVNDLLDHSKIEAGKLIIENHPFSLTELVTDVQETLSFLAEKKGITLSVLPEQPSDFQLLGDRLRLYQILYNLVSNSLKFTEKGKVEISVQTKERGTGQLLVTFQVKDSGIGIQPEKIKTIFDSFVQAEAAITRSFGGTGLGLAISNELVKLMGGSLEVRSIPGLGSTFFFSILLPTTSSDCLEPQDDLREESDFPSEKLHVLLVEDDKGNQELASAILKSAGHTVTVTNHGLEALELLANGESFHAILMDVQMPVLDGLATTQCIRRVEGGGVIGLQECEHLEQNLASNLYGGHQYIIAMTANTMLGDKERCRESGVDNFLAKPYTKAHLLTVLKKSTKDSRQNGDLCKKDLLEDNSGNDIATVSYDRCRQYLLENFNLNDESSRHVLDTFLNSLQHDLEQLKESILEGNRDAISLFSHKMKGALYNINLDKLANLAQELENHAHDQGLVELGNITDKIRKSLSPLMKKIWKPAEVVR